MNVLYKVATIGSLVTKVSLCLGRIHERNIRKYILCSTHKVYHLPVSNNLVFKIHM